MALGRRGPDARADGGHRSRADAARRARPGAALRGGGSRRRAAALSRRDRGIPGRLEEIEERLALFRRLERKHGGSIAEVLAHAERCRTRRDQLERAEVELGHVAAAGGGADELSVFAGALSAARTAAAPGLAEAVRRDSPSWRWSTRPSRSSCGRGRTASGPAAVMSSSSCSRRIRVCPPDRCARSHPAASSPGRMLALLSAAHSSDARGRARDAAARVRRDRRRDRRAHRPCRRRPPAGARRPASDPLHHPSAAGGRPSATVISRSSRTVRRPRLGRA